MRANARRYQHELQNLYETLHYLAQAGLYDLPANEDELHMLQILDGTVDHREEKFVELACRAANTKYIRIH